MNDILPRYRQNYLSALLTYFMTFNQQLDLGGIVCMYVYNLQISCVEIATVSYLKRYHAFTSYFKHASVQKHSIAFWLQIKMFRFNNVR